MFTRKRVGNRERDREREGGNVKEGTREGGREIVPLASRHG
jgi:hypothetical protein